MAEELSPIVVLFKRLPHGDGLPPPAYATSGASGMDLCAAVGSPLLLRASGGVCCVPTAFCVELPPGYEAQVRPRSGLAAERGVTVLNAPGTIDGDYRGEIKVLLINASQRDFVVERGMRIAQLVVAPVVRAQISVAGVLSRSKRGDEGFGSTGLF